MEVQTKFHYWVLRYRAESVGHNFLTYEVFAVPSTSFECLARASKELTGLKPRHPSVTCVLLGSRGLDSWPRVLYWWRSWWWQWTRCRGQAGNMGPTVCMTCMVAAKFITVISANTKLLSHDFNAPESHEVVVTRGCTSWRLQYSMKVRALIQKSGVVDDILLSTFVTWWSADGQYSRWSSSLQVLWPLANSLHESLKSWRQHFNLKLPRPSYDRRYTFLWPTVELVCSRFCVTQAGRWLVLSGWFWHCRSCVHVYRRIACIFWTLSGSWRWRCFSAKNATSSRRSIRTRGSSECYRSGRKKRAPAPVPVKALTLAKWSTSPRGLGLGGGLLECVEQGVGKWWTPPRELLAACWPRGWAALLE